MRRAVIGNNETVNPLASDAFGNHLLEIVEVSEEAASEYSPITDSIIMAEHQDRVLMVFHRQRRYWELPGGGIEIDETPKDCAIRELLEETNQAVTSVNFRALIKIWVATDRTTAYNAIFSVILSSIEDFNPNEEVERIMLWDGREELEEMSSIDRKLVEFFSAGHG